MHLDGVEMKSAPSENHLWPPASRTLSLCAPLMSLTLRHNLPCCGPPAPLLPSPLPAATEEECKGIRTVETQSLHKGVAGARHSFLPLPGGGTDKLDVLVQVSACLCVCVPVCRSSNT